MTELHIYFTSLQDIYHHFVLVVICSVLTGGLAAYQNDWDHVLNVMCNRYQGEALYSVQSRHSNRKEDRHCMHGCGNANGLSREQCPVATGLVTKPCNHDEPVADLEI